MKKLKIFDKEKRIDLFNIVLLLLCVFPIVTFFMRMNSGVVLPQNVWMTISYLVGAIGLLSYYNGYGKSAIIFELLNLLTYGIRKLVYEKVSINSVYFWIFILVLIYFLYNEISKFPKKGK